MNTFSSACVGFISVTTILWTVSLFKKSFAIDGGGVFFINSLSRGCMEPFVLGSYRPWIALERLGSLTVLWNPDHTLWTSQYWNLPLPSPNEWGAVSENSTLSLVYNLLLCKIELIFITLYNRTKILLLLKIKLFVILENKTNIDIEVRL